MHDYSEIFTARADQYHFAMQTYPKARDAEFLALLKDLPSNAIDLLDVPSGGGYLASFLPSHMQINSCDFSAGFAETGVPLASPHCLPYANASVDAVLSLTGLHHISRENQNAFLGECHRVLRAEGSVLVGEVLRGSPVDTFLNDFVHKHNSQGHVGDFFDEGFKQQLADAGFVQSRMQVRSYVWNFDNAECMINYCKNMFGIDQASDSQIEQGISEYLGYRTSEAGCIELPWQLVFYSAVKG
jgi:ubiquinone/menaquinone biosynthesis C-methylase UbiE